MRVLNGTEFRTIIENHVLTRTTNELILKWFRSVWCNHVIRNWEHFPIKKKTVVAPSHAKALSITFKGQDDHWRVATPEEMPRLVDGFGTTLALGKSKSLREAFDEIIELVESEWFRARFNIDKLGKMSYLTVLQARNKYRQHKKKLHLMHGEEHIVLAKFGEFKLCRMPHQEAYLREGLLMGNCVGRETNGYPFGHKIVEILSFRRGTDRIINAKLVKKIFISTGVKGAKAVMKEGQFVNYVEYNRLFYDLRSDEMMEIFKTCCEMAGLEVYIGAAEYDRLSYVNAMSELMWGNFQIGPGESRRVNLLLDDSHSAGRQPGARETAEEPRIQYISTPPMRNSMVELQQISRLVRGNPPSPQHIVYFDTEMHIDRWSDIIADSFARVSNADRMVAVTNYRVLKERNEPKKPETAICHYLAPPKFDPRPIEEVIGHKEEPYHQILDHTKRARQYKRPT